MELNHTILVSIYAGIALVGFAILVFIWGAETYTLPEKVFMVLIALLMGSLWPITLLIAGIIYKGLD